MMNKPSPVDLYSPSLRRLFLIYLHRYFAKHFHAVRTSGSVPQADGPMIVYTNHPGWWDPIHLFLLSSFVAPDLRMYGPFDAAALEQYGFFKRLGAFGIEPTPRGAARFIRVGREVLQAPQGSLWITAEGQFSDPRNRPIRLRPGLGHLVRRLPRATVVPLAIEYPFWSECHPEALTRFGRPFHVENGGGRTAEDWTEQFETRLGETMDALAEDVRSRQPERFQTLLSGSAGVGGVYDRWRRFKAMLRGETFVAAHGDGR